MATITRTARAEWQAPEIDGCVIINDADDSLRTDEGEIDLERVEGKFCTVTVTGSGGYDLIGRLERAG